MQTQVDHVRFLSFMFLAQSAVSTYCVKT